MSHVLPYAINHMVAPRKSIAELIALASALRLDAIEIRNDLPGQALEGDPKTVCELAKRAGIRILSINALQRFNDWSDARAAEARALARYARGCGAGVLVLCPVNDATFRPSETERRNGLREALRGLAPILAEADIVGTIEPLGFETSSLRLKAEAVGAILDLGERDRFRIVHDTFHHYLVGEPHLLPEWTALVHISGVESDLAPDALRDPHRVLVGPRDRLGNVAQIAALLAGGYGGRFSFEPFAASVQASHDIAGALAASMHWIDAELARAQV